LQVLTQPRDSASLEDEPFFHEEALPLAVTEQRITPASAIKHQAELLEPPLSSADMEGKYAAAKQQKLARAPRQKKTCAVAAQKNDLRKYFAVVKGVRYLSSPWRSNVMRDRSTIVTAILL
jgi:hypothetical protein